MCVGYKLVIIELQHAIDKISAERQYMLNWNI